MIRVTVWTENEQERKQASVIKAYPQGIYACIAEFLGKETDFTVRTATQDQPDQGLPPEVLDNTDVLIWWAHLIHKDVDDQLVARVVDRVHAGMGVIFLHSAHKAKPFMRLVGSSGALKWFEHENVHERLWVTDPGHPIAQGLGEYIDLAHEEMYGEHFDIPQPESLIFVGWYNSGHVFRSGMTWTRGKGKVFYFQPGHETFPTYKHPEIQRVLKNAVRFVAPIGEISPLDCPKVSPIENIE